MITCLQRNPKRDGSITLKIVMRLVLATTLIASLISLGAQAEPKSLLTGTVQNGATGNEPGNRSGNRSGNEPQGLRFSLTGENRQDIIGGEIKLGERAFTIDKVSRQGMIGASRSAPHSEGTPGRYVEFAVFSSSFSEQTATGQPWVAGKIYVNCNQDYNSFLAIYRLNDSSIIAGFDKSPYPVLLQDIDKSDDSIVYCFNSKPPA